MDELCENIQNLKIDKKEKQIIKIQAMFRGFLQRKKNLEKTDNFDLETINKLLDKYIFYVREITLINLKLRKKIRKPNFPSELSENITKFIIAKKKGFLPTWNCNGDLKFVFNGKKIEVKAFSSDGPISFGPNENWFRLYILDCRNFICYEIKLRNGKIY